MKSIVAICSLLLSLASFAQTKGSGTLYGYRQASTPGTVRKVAEENSSAPTEIPGKGGETYFIYLVTSARAFPSEMWIKGEPYSVRLHTIAKTPVEQPSSNVLVGVTKKVLVPKTTQQVIRLTPAPPVSGKRSTKSKALAANNDLVVVYKQNGKFYYQALPMLDEIEPVVLQ